MLCAKGCRFFPKAHFVFAVSFNARKIRPKKIKEFQYFFKFTIDPIFEFCYTFQTYLCKMGGSLSVRLNFFRRNRKVIKKVCAQIFFISDSRGSRMKCVVVNGARKLHLEFLLWRNAIGSWCQTSCQAML